MKGSEDSQKPGSDDALEARIVAWVLGEASPFEAAELEKLCAEDPKLREFERRMRDLDAILAADAKPGMHASWKLPEGKRQKITDLLGAVPMATAEQDKKVNRYFARRILLAAAACVAISLVSYPLFSNKQALGKTVMAEAPPEKTVDFMPASPAVRTVEPEASVKRQRAFRGVGEEAGDLLTKEIRESAIEEQVRLSAADGSTPAEPELLAKKTEKASDPADLYFQGWLQSKDSEKLKSEGRDSEARAKLADARRNFQRVQEEHPDWKKQMVGGRVVQTDEQLAQLSEEPKLREAEAKSISDTSLAAGANLTDGLRSGDGPVMRNNLDAIPPGAVAEDAMEMAKKDAPADSPQNLPALALQDQDPNVYRFSQQEIVPRKPGEMPILDPSAPQGFTLNYSQDANRMARSNGGSGSTARPDAAQAIFGITLYQNGTTAGLGGRISETPEVAAAQNFFGDPSGATEVTREFAYPDAFEAPRLPDLAGMEDGLADLDAESVVTPATPTVPAENGVMAPGAQHAENVDKVRRSLYLAEGGYNLGKYDDAVRHYEDVLRVDPSNKAARRGLERVAQAKTDYYRAAYDHTRAELLSQVDAAWELQPPSGVAPAQQAAGAPGAGAVSELAQQELARRQQTAGDAERLAGEAKNARESGDLERAYKLQTDALGLIPEAPASLGRRAELKLSLAEIAAGLAVDAKTKGKEDSAKEWAGKALQWNPQQKDAKQVLDLEGGDETSAVAEPFSTFSLHVSDASFKLAKAALDRGEQPDPAGIRSEEFYNAFDYGDPAPAPGEPVVCVSEQAAHPILPQRNLVRIGVRTAAAGRGGSTPLNLTLLLDSSGSMEREDRQTAMLRAVDQLSKLLKEGDTITVAGFARTPRLLADRLPGARAGELNTIIAQTPSEGGTNLEEGLKLAEELAKRQFNAAAQNRIVLFTDGAANLGDAQPESLQARVEQLRQEGIAFDAAGFGAEGLNDRLLERLTRNGNGRYYVVDQAEDAGDGFAKQLAGAFRPAAENVKVQVRFNAARVARYKLIGFEEHRLAKEDFKNDAVDAAEMAAEEAGNALYQIQTLPEGEGEIGEVSVRFRDVASGQMVERTWTIPYEAQAAAFDQATASMKLAGLAMMAAEKLRNGPMAEAVDFSRFGKVFADVKSEFAGSGKVEEFGGMVERLK
ncbi:von Willebrand factor type A domain-containing protein [Luteolibacter sp. GHJ8]|uniref:von Willebrand factor type A domain-containing protein n=1 Tax=Luteolibacter rhizosphaerae TaxID=2989719 RepID=A0ABT3FYH5_9BACT|nr:von Willebrand factor type A domain-containing protein [Luteolibacter rhizosphaerae]MCW1912284.1 von Willebrand factor type A domain-containing protein [Luteolibacter rhizosphaerae]